MSEVVAPCLVGGFRSRLCGRGLAQFPAGDGQYRTNPAVQVTPDAIQDRSTCCGTIQLGEYLGKEKALQVEIGELVKALADVEKGTIRPVKGLPVILIDE